MDHVSVTGRTQVEQNSTLSWQVGNELHALLVGRRELHTLLATPVQVKGLIAIRGLSAAHLDILAA